MKDDTVTDPATSPGQDDPTIEVDQESLKRLAEMLKTELPKPQAATLSHQIGALRDSKLPPPPTPNHTSDTEKA